MSEYWKKEIESAEKRQKNFWQKGSKVVDRFLDQRKEIRPGIDDSSFSRLNLFHANITTQMAMMYGRVPKVDVGRRFDDAGDDIGRISAELLQRMLNTSIQAPGSNECDVLRSCLQDRMLPGLGVARVRYDIRTSKEAGEDGEEYEVLESESAVVEYTHWRDFLWGYSRTWSTVPWVGFKTYLTKEEVEKRFGEESAKKLPFEIRNIGQKDDESKDPDKDRPWETAEIIEIWCKKDRKVKFYAKGADEILEEIEPPIDFLGFFPTPEPMAANVTTSLWIPKSDFTIAQDLYNQIDTLQTRIDIITRAVKVVGVYDQKATGVQRMLEEGTDNDLFPVDNWAAFAERGGVKGQVDWLPIEAIANVLTKLQEMRAEAIQLLYQVTGMSDILRGESDQYTSASSDKLKAKFASIRMQYLQEEFSRFASDLMSLKAEVICSKFEARTIIQQANAEYLDEEQEAIIAAVEFLKEEVNKILWKIDIKPESIAMIDYAQLKAERTEYLTAVATFLQSATSLIGAAPSAAPILIQMLKWGLAGFKGATTIEGALDRYLRSVEEALSQPQEPQPNPKIEEINAKAQAEMQKEALKAQNKFNELIVSHKQDMERIMAETDAKAQQEQLQAYFNILEKNAASAAKMQEVGYAENIRARSRNKGAS